MRWLRTIILLLACASAAGVIIWMQRKFEAADAGHALTLVHQYRARGNVSVPELLSYHHPGRAPVWHTEVESSCFQHIRVEAWVNADPAKPPLVYAFVVDINGPSLHPGNESGVLILEQLDRPPADLRAVLRASAAPSALPSSSSGTERAQ